MNTTSTTGPLAVCIAAGGEDINAALVRDPAAWAFIRYSDDDVAEQASARRAGAGVWQADNEPPWDYRATRWQAAEQAAPASCPIKGNFSDKGRIYHTPWLTWYGRRRVNLDHGERWFCSESEAVDAGWRVPRWC